MSIVLRGTPEQLARIEQRRHRGLLAWLYGDGVLLIPPDMQPPSEDGDDPLLRDLEKAMREPVQPWPVVLEPEVTFRSEMEELMAMPWQDDPPRRRWRLPRWLSRRG